MIAFIILILINAYILTTTREPRELVEVKEKYQILRQHFTDTDHPKFNMLQRPVPLTGMKSMNGAVGYNTNKGHCTVDEYSHSDEYWNNYIELRDICVNLGIYEKIPEMKKFCGSHVQDK